MAASFTAMQIYCAIIFIMVKDSFDKLNDGQRHCLRLVLAHMNSKEIGRELDISPHTVDQRLRESIRMLECNTRFEAARKFAEYEGAEIYQPLIYQSSDIEKTAESSILSGSANLAKGIENSLITGASNIENGSATLVFEKPQTRNYRLPFPRYRGEKNELGSVERLGWIIVIAIGSAISFGGLLAGLEALSRLAG